MIYFSLISMLYAVLDFIVQPYMHSYGAAYVMIMDLRNSVFEDYPIIGVLLVALLCGCYSLTIYSIAINFVYRFFALQREGRLRFFHGKKLIFWIFIPILAGAGWVINNWIFLRPDSEKTEYLRSRVKEKYDFDIDKTSYTGGLYWRTDPYGNQYLSMKDMIGALGLNQLFAIPLVTIIYFGRKSYGKIKELLKQGESEYSKKLQLQLHKALVAQTVIPMIFLFVPIGCFLTFPFFKIDIEWASRLITFLYTVYPAIDPIPTIVFIDNYRMAISNFIRRILGKPQISIVSHEMTADAH
ncbi:hypothetical protein L3Y34_006680 [Caenorhabditis briggsae]|uniref:Serpentine receptor class r-10 n=1 Tax=Caenorhabditis briggsae TaxID=6238 RepID=A0AAE9CZ60_CAEBR|nr:hypothetical protein L3Y34_006680 [Caenorhabditis briggsae]